MARNFDFGFSKLLYCYIVTLLCLSYVNSFNTHRCVSKSKIENSSVILPISFLWSRNYLLLLSLKLKSPQKILIMTTYRFAITELRHHNFANRLDVLYDKAMGKCLSYKDSFFECHN